MKKCNRCGFSNPDSAWACFACFRQLPEENKENKENEEAQATEENSAQGLIRKAASFAKATVSHAADGFKNVSSEKKKQRQDICNACEFINKDNNTCNQCGCYLDVKTSWRTTSCPIGKWGPEEAKTDNGIILPAYSRPAKKCGGCGKKS